MKYVTAATANEEQRASIEWVRGRLDSHAPACVCETMVTFGAVRVGDRFGLDVRWVLCPDCGTVRQERQMFDHDLAAFYRDHYRILHPEAGTPSERRAKQTEDARRIKAMLPLEAPRVVIEMGADCGGGYPVWPSYHESDDPEQLPYAPQADLLYSVHALEHVPDPAGTLGAWACAVRVGGTIVTVVPDLMQTHLGQYAPGDWWTVAHLWEWTRDTVALLHMLAGLRVERVEVAGPGVFASVGSLVVVARKVDHAGDVRRYLEQHA